MADHDSEMFIPRPMSPSVVMEGENWRAKRICVSGTIDGALSAIATSLVNPFGQEYYVHTVINNLELFKDGSVYQPTQKQVPDAPLTGELWLKKPALMKCIGKIAVTGIDANADMSYIDNDGELVEVDAFTWKWIDKKDQQPKQFEGGTRYGKNDQTPS